MMDLLTKNWKTAVGGPAAALGFAAFEYMPENLPDGWLGVLLFAVWVAAWIWCAPRNTT